MPIDTEQWRAQTGLYCASRKLPRLPKCSFMPKQMAETAAMLKEIIFAVVMTVVGIGTAFACNAQQQVSSAASLLPNLLLLTIKSATKLLQRAGGVIGLLALSLVVVQMLLIMAGDVERNPGPETPVDQGPLLASTSVHVPTLSPASPIRASPLNPSTTVEPMELQSEASSLLQQPPIVSQDAARRTTDDDRAMEMDTQSTPLKPREGMKRQRKRSCGRCPNCRKEDCGICKYCKDKPKFGGKGKWKQRCIERRCSNMIPPPVPPVNRKIDKYFKPQANTEPGPAATQPPAPMEAQSSYPTADPEGQSSDGDTPELPTQVLQHSDQHRTAMVNQAIKKGYIRTRIIRSLINGPPGVGKSHLLVLLLGKPRPPIRNSTGIVKPPDEIYVPRRVETEMIYAAAPSNWRQLQSIDDKEQILTDWVRAHCHGEEIDTDTTVDSDSEYVPGTSSTRKAVIEKLKQCNSDEQIPDMQFIHFMDTGGQPHFLEIQPAFVRNTSINLVVFKMCEKLGDRPRFEFVIDGKEMMPGHKEWLQITNLQMIKQTARTLLSCKYSSQVNTTGLVVPSEPKMMLIGTFKDKVNQCSETPEMKERILNDQLIISALINPNNILLDTLDESLIFQIDGSEQGWETNGRIIDEIRQAIENTSHNLVADIPARWYFLQIDLLKAAKASEWRILRLEDCYQIGKNLGYEMSNEEIERALKYFNELNIFLYFKDVVKDAIFCDPHFLVKKISDLVAASFPGSKHYYPDVSRGDRENFRYCGIFTADLLDNRHFQDGYEPNLFTPKDFINLLEHLYIIARTGKSKKHKAKAGEMTEFFMPCVLPPVRADERERRRSWEPQSDKISPLMIHFPHGWSPRGLFCALIVSLASVSIDAPGWEVSHNKDRPSPRRNLIEFKRPRNPGTVIIVDAMTRFEVHAPGTNPASCSDIRRTILKKIDEVLPKFFYNRDQVEHQSGFSCVCSRKRDEVHVAVVEEKKKVGRFLRCTKDDSYCIEWTNWTEKEKVWFPEDEQHSGPSPPKRSKLAGVYDRVTLNRDRILHFLAININPGTLADKLLVAGLINDDVREKALVTGLPVSETIRPMIDAVITRIDLNPVKYDLFISVLKQLGAEDLVQYIENN